MSFSRVLRKLGAHWRQAVLNNDRLNAGDNALAHSVAGKLLEMVARYSRIAELKSAFDYREGCGAMTEHGKDLQRWLLAERPQIFLTFGSHGGDSKMKARRLAGLVSNGIGTGTT